MLSIPLFRYILFIHFISIKFFTLHSQTSDEIFLELIQKNPRDIIFITRLPDSTRQNFLFVSMFPAELTKLHAIREFRNKEIANAIAKLTEEDQIKIWYLVNNIPLIHDLIKTQATSEPTKNILFMCSPEIYEIAIYFTTRQPFVLNFIYLIQLEFDIQSANILSDFNLFGQKAFFNIINNPEAFNLIHQNQHLTVSLGNCYKINPEATIHNLESLSLLLAKLELKIVSINASN